MWLIGAAVASSGIVAILWSSGQCGLLVYDPECYRIQEISSWGGVLMIVAGGAWVAVATTLHGIRSRKL